MHEMTVQELANELGTEYGVASSLLVALRGLGHAQQVGYRQGKKGRAVGLWTINPTILEALKRDPVPT